MHRIEINIAEKYNKMHSWRLFISHNLADIIVARKIILDSWKG